MCSRLCQKGLVTNELHICEISPNSSKFYILPFLFYFGGNLPCLEA